MDKNRHITHKLKGGERSILPTESKSHRASYTCRRRQHTQFCTLRATVLQIMSRGPSTRKTIWCGAP